ncbi:MAG: D-glycero-beta-D-manno-heptose 1-phosphate adenylyltransferase [Phycisphaerae bacterium]|nr:D-glycero-beta-D-manno-heptose 1-phosphate adenylyltransferase [Phycisphaerae bacterium]
MSNWERLLQLMEGPGGGRIAVVGDFMLDAYLYGDAERISPEAPVPVLRVVQEEIALGGAGSVAADVAALGDRACCFGIVGDDDAGRTIREQLTARGAEVAGLLTVAGRPTTKKTRLVGLAQHRHRQQLIRVDAEQREAIDAGVAARIIAALRGGLTDCRAICVEDYGKGLVTDALMKQVLELARSARLPVLVDPARTKDYGRYAGATVVTPNRSETEHVTGLRLATFEAVRSAARTILEACGTQQVCVTLDAEGMALIGPDSQVSHIPTRAREVYDVTGAGDEVLAALTVGLARGATLIEACALANVAGGLAVERFGCVPISRDEVIAELMQLSHEQMGKRRDLPRLLPELARRRQRGQRIVFTNGCFDLLHPGHVEYLSAARREGDVLVVGLNSDASVRGQSKGSDRPILGQNDRARMLSALADVDFVVIFDEPTPARLIEAIRPDVLVKGEDWSDKGVVGRELVESYGGRVVLAKLVEGFSTSALIERIRRGSGSEI